MSIRASWLHIAALNPLVGATEYEVIQTVEKGEEFPAKFGRTGFRRNFVSQNKWRGKTYATKQVEVLAVREGTDWIVITVITKFF